jgi:hypothetical protein
MDYNFNADLLNKFSQLATWVQVFVTFIAGGTITALAYLGYKTVERVSYHIVCCIQLERGRRERGE